MTAQLPYKLLEQPKLNNQKIKSRPTLSLRSQTVSCDLNSPQTHSTVTQTILIATKIRASTSKVLKGKPTQAQRVQSINNLEVPIIREGKSVNKHQNLSEYTLSLKSYTCHFKDYQNCYISHIIILKISTNKCKNSMTFTFTYVCVDKPTRCNNSY